MAALALEVVSLPWPPRQALSPRVRRPGNRLGLPSVFLQTQRRRLSDIVASPSGFPLFARQPWHLSPPSVGKDAVSPSAAGRAAGTPAGTTCVEINQ